jgi:hypothetical protein
MIIDLMAMTSKNAVTTACASSFEVFVARVAFILSCFITALR